MNWICVQKSVKLQVPLILENWKRKLLYGVVPKGLLIFLGSLYREVAKTTSGALVCRFERQTARKKKKSSFEKHCILDLESRIFFLNLRNPQIAAFCILLSYFMKSKLKKISIDSW